MKKQTQKKTCTQQEENTQQEEAQQQQEETQNEADTNIQTKTIENIKSTREKHAPKKYDDYICNQTTRYPIENHVIQKLLKRTQNILGKNNGTQTPTKLYSGCKIPHWQEAMKSEIIALKQNETWDMVQVS